MSSRFFGEIPKRPLVRDEVRARIVESINKGKLAPGEQLASEVEIARQLGVSRNSVREALQSLEREGLIEKRHGVGTFVTTSEPLLYGGIERLTSINDFISSHGLKPESQIVEMDYIIASDREAQPLDIELGSDVLCVKLLKKIEERLPVALCIDYIPTRLLTGEIDSSKLDESVFDFLNDHGLNTTYADCEITACNAEGELSELLQVRAGEPLLLFKQVHFAENDLRALYSETFFVPGKVRFNIVRRW